MVLSAKFLVRRWKLSSIVIVLVTVISLVGATRLSFDVSPNAVFSSDNRVSRELERLQSAFGHDDNDLAVILEGEDLFQPERLAQLRQLRDQLASLPDVDQVSSVFDLRLPGTRLVPLIPKYFRANANMDELRQSVTENPVATNQLISKDGRMMLMWLHVEGESLPLSKVTGVVGSVRECTSDFEQSSGIPVLLAGHLMIRAETLTTLQSSMLRSSVMATVVAALVAFILFRGPVPVFICCIGPIFGVIWTLGGMGWAGQQIGGLGTILPTLVMVIGLTDSVHLLLETNRQLSRGRNHQAAVFHSLVRIGPACLLTCLTTVIGFGSLLLSETYSVRQFGICAASGSALAVFADLLVLPVAVRCVNPASLIRHHTEAEIQLVPWVERFAAVPLRHARWTALTSICVCGLLLWPAFQQEPDIVWTETLPKDSESVHALQRIDERIGGALRAYVVISWPSERAFPDEETIRVIAEVHHAIEETEGLSGAFSVLNVLAAVPGKDFESRFRLLRRRPDAQLTRLINTQRNRLVVSAQVPNDGAAALEQRTRRLEFTLQQIAEDHPGYSFEVTGTVVAAARNMRSFIGDLGKSIAAASIIILFVLAVSFRSLRLGLISVIPNGFPLIVTAAGLVLLGYPLQITSAMTFSLCLGLAVDDTIHILTRFRFCLQRKGLSPGEAVAQTVSTVGPALAITTAILVSGFGTMTTSPTPGIQMFAVLSCIIMIAAFIGDMLILPSLLVIAGKASSPGPK